MGESVGKETRPANAALAAAAAAAAAAGDGGGGGGGGARAKGGGGGTGGIQTITAGPGIVVSPNVSGNVTVGSISNNLVPYIIKYETTNNGIVNYVTSTSSSSVSGGIPGWNFGPILDGTTLITTTKLASQPTFENFACYVSNTPNVYTFIAVTGYNGNGFQVDVGITGSPAVYTLHLQGANQAAEMPLPSQPGVTGTFYLTFFDANVPVFI